MYLFFKLVILYSTSDTYLVFKAKLSITFFKISSILWNFYDKPLEHQRPVDKKYSVHIHHLHLALKRSKSIAAYIYSKQAMGLALLRPVISGHCSVRPLLLLPC